MNKIKALALEKELKDTEIRNFKVIELINNGKSAAVFKVEKEGNLFALKIFDNELVERFGHEIQKKRIDQEILLKNHSINNLVKIYDGGRTTIKNQDFYFIVMEFIDGINLKDFIKKESYKQNFVLNVLDKLYNTTEQLLNQKQIVHRDIKPENIMVTIDGRIILMDLGVLKLVGVKSFTDEEERSFVGTLRYAPPEFLLRTEEDSVNGWRAVNFYQIGATLHDLIAKHELFHDKTPYTNLVIAIKEDIPTISNSSFSFELLQLTRDMLTKNWKKRLELIPTERIERVKSIKEGVETHFEENVEKIFQLRIKHQAKFDEIEKLQRTKEELRKRRNEIGSNLIGVIDKCFNDLQTKEIFTSLNKSKIFSFRSDELTSELLIQNYLYELNGDLKMGFPRNLYILVRISNDETNYTEIGICGIFPSTILGVGAPHFFFQGLAKERPAYNPHFAPKTVTIFKGISEFDNSFKALIGTQILSLIFKALKTVEKEVQDELKWYEDRAKSKKSFEVRVTISPGNTIIDSF